MVQIQEITQNHERKLITILLFLIKPIIGFIELTCFIDYLLKLPLELQKSLQLSGHWQFSQWVL